MCKRQVSNLPPERLGMDQCHASRSRLLEGAMFRDSWYLATVWRTIRMLYAPNKSAILLSFNGFFVFSATTSLLVIARIAAGEYPLPSAVLT